MTNFSLTPVDVAVCVVIFLVICVVVYVLVRVGAIAWYRTKSEHSRRMLRELKEESDGS